MFRREVVTLRSNFGSVLAPSKVGAWVYDLNSLTACTVCRRPLIESLFESSRVDELGENADLDIAVGVLDLGKGLKGS